jgi:hypothetical protein
MMEEEQEYFFNPLPPPLSDGNRYELPEKSSVESWEDWTNKRLSELEFTISDDNQFSFLDKQGQTVTGNHAHYFMLEHEYEYRLWMQRHFDEMVGGERSARLLRSVSYAGEEEESMRMWQHLTTLLEEKLVERYKLKIQRNKRIKSEESDILEIHEYQKKRKVHQPILKLISRTIINVLISLSKTHKLCNSLIYDLMNKEDLVEHANANQLNNQDHSITGFTKIQLKTYFDDMAISPPEDVRRKAIEIYGEEGRTVSVPQFLERVWPLIYRDIKKSMQACRDLIIEDDAVGELTIISDQNEPIKIIIDQISSPSGFGSQSGGHNHNASLDTKIKQYSQNLAFRVLSLLEADLDWIRFRKGESSDAETHYATDYQSRIDILERWHGSPPNMIYFTNNLFQILQDWANEYRKTSPLYSNQQEDHPIFRMMSNATKRWRYGLPEKYTPGSPSIILSNSQYEKIVDRPIPVEKPPGNEKIKIEKTPQRSVLGLRAVEALNHLQETQWELNEEFFNCITTGYKITHDKVPVRGEKDHRKIEFQPWINELIKELKMEMNQETKTLQNDYYKGANKTSNSFRRFRLDVKKIEEALQHIEIKEREWSNSLASCFKAIRNSKNIFWHKWACDWRGRFYPISNLLSPQGDDFNKALIRFKEWKPLGDDGWKWLQIHLCTLFSGIDCPVAEEWNGGNSNSRWPFEKRQKWTEENMKLLIEMAQIFNQKGNQDNKKSLLRKMGFKIKRKDTIFQCLAALLELERVYMEFKVKGDWDDIKSGLPVNLDASCNGFQHAAALLRSKKLAQKVNLLRPEPGVDAEDLYQAVVDRAFQNFEQGSSNLRRHLSKKYKLNSEEITRWGELFKHRNLVKQATINAGYGSTKFDTSLGGRNGEGDLAEEYFSRKEINYKYPNLKKIHPKSKKKFKSKSRLIEHMYTEKFKIFHPTSPLAVQIDKIPEIKQFFDENPKVIQAEILKKISKDISDAIKEETDNAFERLGVFRLRKILLRRIKNKQLVMWETGDEGVKINLFTLDFENKLIQFKGKDNQVTEDILPNDHLGLFNRIMRELDRNLTKDFTSIEEICNYLEIEHTVTKEGKTRSKQKSISEINSRLRAKIHDRIVRQADLESESSKDRKFGLSKNHLQELLRALLMRMASQTIKNPDKPIITWRYRKKGKEKGMETSITPNFVHSLDAMHMRKVILSAKEKGIMDLWSVHDSFGTHAGDFEELRKIVIEEFYEVHKESSIDDWCQKMLSDFQMDEEEAKIEQTFKEKNLLEIDDIMGSEFLIK